MAQTPPDRWPDMHTGALHATQENLPIKRHGVPACEPWKPREGAGLVRGATLNACRRVTSRHRQIQSRGASEGQGRAGAGLDYSLVHGFSGVAEVFSRIPWQSSGWDSALLPQRAQVQSLLRELRSQKLHSAVKRKVLNLDGGNG